MKKELFFIIVAFAMSSAYSQVGIDINEPTAQLDINGSWRFRQSIEINATQNLSTVLGTYSKNNTEDGYVSPNRISTGLKSSSGKFIVFPNLMGGLVVDTNGLAIKPFIGLTINNSLLNVVPNQNKGIRLNNNQLTAEIGNGLQFNTENAISVRPKLDGGIVTDNEGIGAKNGRAINTDVNGLSVGYDNGITLSADNKLVVDLDYINGQNNTNLGKIGDGLEYQKIDNNYLVMVEPGDGIAVTSDGLAIKPSNGIEVNQNGVNVKPDNGIDVSSNGLSVKTQSTSGLLVNVNGLSIKPGKGIEITTGGLDVKPGNGVSIYVDKVALNTGIATYNDDEAKLRLKLSPNSALGLNDSGLKIQTDQNGGLKINGNQLSVAPDSSLKIGSNNVIGVNVDTSRGLGVDANGVYAKLGSGLEFDSNKNIAKVTSPLAATEADNGLEKSGDKVLLGGILKQSVTTIETDGTNTLALDLLVQNNNTSNKQLVIDSNNRINTINTPIFQNNTTVKPAIYTLNRDIPGLFETLGIGSDITLPVTQLVNDIDNLRFDESTSKITFPPGIYEIKVVLQLEGGTNQQSYTCDLNSYFVDFPKNPNDERRRIHTLTSHKSGGILSFGGSSTYTAVLTGTVVWTVKLGLGQGPNCNDTRYKAVTTLRERSTQITILKIGS